MNEDLLIRAEKWAEEHFSEFDSLLDTLLRIPAPSHKEEKRAEFCKKWLENAGAEGVFIDEKLNVVYPYCVGRRKISAVLAHTDTVFPDLVPFDVVDRDGRRFCPGISDNTIHLAELMMTVKFLLESGIKTQNGILFVCNSGEEGLGNLKGCREIIKNYGERLSCLVSIDGNFNRIVYKAVGSNRYRVTVKTEGGHSYNAFGNKNAIERLSALICRLYQMKIPKAGKTTFNVGTIEGGTSVNTIAQNASMLFEFRSDEFSALKAMEKQFFDIINEAKKQDEIEVEIVGERPCGITSDEEQNALIEKIMPAIKRYYDKEIKLKSGSTDCNIPLSVGIPSICTGGCLGKGAHTREESIELSSMKPGLNIAMATILALI